MALSVNQQALYWGIAALVVLFLLWLLGGILFPFVAGMAIAYFLDPVADRLEAAGFSRALATTIIMLSAVIVLIFFLILIGTQLPGQFSALIAAAPGYFETLATFLQDRFPGLIREDSLMRQGLEDLAAGLRERAGTLANTIISSAFTLLDIAIFMVVAPVVAFYMLLDWDHMVAKVDSWIPRDHLETVRSLALEVDAVLAGFVRGQLTVCAILGAFYAVALMLVGLQFGLIVGLTAGLLTFIPYVGSVIGGVLSIGLALFQFWDAPQWIAVVAAIFVFGQMVEGNVLTPKLVGGSVGLHPVTLMFSLSAFGVLMGFSGLLIAVPVAACIGVFFRYGIGRYLQGRLFQGHGYEYPTGEDDA